MPETAPGEPQPQRPRRRFQFGLGTMLLAVLPISILSAAWAGMMGLGANSTRVPQGFFILMAAAAPMAARDHRPVPRELVAAAPGPALPIGHDRP